MLTKLKRLAFESNLILGLKLHDHVLLSMFANRNQYSVSTLKNIIIF